MTNLEKLEKEWEIERIEKIKLLSKKLKNKKLYFGLKNDIGQNLVLYVFELDEIIDVFDKTDLSTIKETAKSKIDETYELNKRGLVAVGSHLHNRKKLKTFAYFK